MDRHVRWLRRRIVASIAIQTGVTFGIAAVATGAIIAWQADQSWLGSLFAALVIAQLVAAARVGHAIRNNPLNHAYMVSYIESPSTYESAPFNPDEEVHPAASSLPGFTPVATVRSTAESGPVFDVLEDPSRLVVASVSRTSGAIALLSSLTGGRLLVTDACAVPPHERVVVNLAADSDIVAAHQTGLRRRADAVPLTGQADALVLDSLHYEHQAYVELGPYMAPFFDIDGKDRSPLRLVARVKPGELASVEHRCGPHRLPHLRPALAHPATRR